MWNIPKGQHSNLHAEMVVVGSFHTVSARVAGERAISTVLRSKHFQYVTCGRMNHFRHSELARDQLITMAQYGLKSVLILHHLIMLPKPDLSRGQQLCSKLFYLPTLVYPTLKLQLG